MKRFITAILLSAMLLTACGKDGASVETTVSEMTSVVTTEEVTTTETSKTAGEDVRIDEDIIPDDAEKENLAKTILGDYVSDTDNIKIIEGEQAEKLIEAFRNVHINNSRFAFPMLVGELPEGFSIKNYSKEDGEEYNGFYICGASLEYNGEHCATVYVLQKEGVAKEYGIICGFIAMSDFCKWDFNGIELTQDREKIIDILGEPSSYENIGEAVPSTLYLDENGNMLIFPDGMNGVCGMTLDFDSIVDNCALVEYIPYDDFDNMPEIPEMSGEPREFDFNKLFENDCIVIGNDKYPANAKISDLSDDIMLFEYSVGVENYNNPDYVEDSYIAMYKGREFAMIYALRSDSEPTENAVISTWGFMLIDSYPFPASAMDVPFHQTSEVKNFYTGYDDDAIEYEIYKYTGIAENDDEKYLCMLTLMSNSLIVSVTPRTVNPERYDEFANSQ